MGAMRKTTVVLLSTVAMATTLAGVAAAQPDSTVTLTASAAKVVYGTSVTFSGQIAPAAGGETVELRDETEAVVATLSTDAAGTFGTTLDPDRTLTLHAAWQSVVSEPVTVKVRAIVDLRMTAVRLFDTVTIRGTVSPAVPGKRVEIRLLRSGPAMTRA